MSFAALLAACASTGSSPANDPWPVPRDAAIVLQGEFLLVSGVGKADPQAQSQTQRRSTSRDAAILDARARLLDHLRRIMLADGVSVGERATEDAGWRKKLNDAAAGIEVASTQWDNGDAAVVTLRVEKASVNRALGLDE